MVVVNLQFRQSMYVQMMGARPLGFCPTVSQCPNDDAYIIGKYILAPETGVTLGGSSKTFTCQGPEYAGHLTFLCNGGYWELTSGNQCQRKCTKPVLNL